MSDDEIIYENLDKSVLIDQLKEVEEQNKKLSDHNIDLGARLSLAETAASLGSNMDRIGFIRVVRDLMGFDLRGAKEYADLFRIEDGNSCTEAQRQKRYAILEAKVEQLRQQAIIASGVEETEQKLLLQLEEMGREKLRLEGDLRGLNVEMDEVSGKLHALEDSLENDKALLQEDLKSVIRMLTRGNIEDSLPILLNVLSPPIKKTEPDEDSIPF